MRKNILLIFTIGNYFKYKNTVIVGVRDLDPLEKENLKKCGVTLFTTQDIKEQGIEEICKKAFNIASNNTEGIHISYDIDVIDPQIAPGVSVPAEKGINLDEAYAITDEIIKNKNLVRSIDIVEFNPLKDVEKATQNITQTIFNKLYNNLNNNT